MKGFTMSRFWIQAALLAGCLLLSLGNARAQSYVELVNTPEGCRVYVDGKDFVAEGCNMHVRDASGQTWCDSEGNTSTTDDDCDNTGNLTVGWNEEEGASYLGRTGNHNVIVGWGHDYSSYGSLITGRDHSVGAPFCGLLGGLGNMAHGDRSGFVGGFSNTSWDDSLSAALIGGTHNSADDLYSTTVGGQANHAGGGWSTVSGGYDNLSSGEYSTVLGGEGNEAAGDYSSVFGEIGYTAAGDYDTNDMMFTTRVSMPRNDGNNTRINARSSYGPHRIDFNQSFPCTPQVYAQVFNSGTGQTAPFIVSINSTDSSGFNYTLVNPASTSQRAYTASVQYAVFCN